MNLEKKKKKLLLLVFLVCYSYKFNVLKQITKLLLMEI